MGIIQNLKLMWKLNPKRVNQMFLFILEHTAHRCAYCSREYGEGLNIPILDILKHMANEHTGKIEIKEINAWIRKLS